MAVAVNTQRNGTKKRRSLRCDHFINNSLIAVIEIDNSVFYLFIMILTLTRQESWRKVTAVGRERNANN